jgi:hypothetical protein
LNEQGEFKTLKKQNKIKHKIGHPESSWQATTTKSG